ncbi:MAG: HEAT repeat domain-containing protein [Novipirellula sp. JB048]
MTICRKRITFSLGKSFLIAWMFCSLSGCQDGPLYALKTVNPWFVMKEWRDDEVYGVTDHERRKQLTQLAKSIGYYPPDRQEYWADHLQQILENDDSAEMRRIAVLASGKIKSSRRLALIEQGLDDDSVKVRMEACRALGRVDDEQAARLLAAMVGKESNRDVRHAAIESLAQHDNAVAVNSLRLALSDRNPATQDLTLQSLRRVTGKDFGNDPEIWVAELEKHDLHEPNSTGTMLR